MNMTKISTNISEEHRRAFDALTATFHRSCQSCKITRTADQHEVALVIQEVSRSQITDQSLVDLGLFEVELFQFPGRRQFGNCHLILFDGARLLLADLGIQKDEVRRMRDEEHRAVPEIARLFKVSERTVRRV